jgi:hypothetical protein
MAERGGVVFAGADHEPVVFGGEGGVEPAGLVGADEQRLTQQREQFRQPRVPPARDQSQDLARDLADYDCAFGLTDTLTGDGQVA